MPAAAAPTPRATPAASNDPRCGSRGTAACTVPRVVPTPTTGPAPTSAPIRPAPRASRVFGDRCSSEAAAAHAQAARADRLITEGDLAAILVAGAPRQARAARLDIDILDTGPNRPRAHLIAAAPGRAGNGARRLAEAATELVIQAHLGAALAIGPAARSRATAMIRGLHLRNPGPPQQPAPRHERCARFSPVLDVRYLPGRGPS